MDSTDVPKHTMTPSSSLSPLHIYHFVFFVLTLTSRLFDADYVISSSAQLCVKEKKREKGKKKRKTSKEIITFCFHFEIPLCSFVRDIIQAQFGYVKTVRRKKILEFF